MWWGGRLTVEDCQGRQGGGRGGGGGGGYSMWLIPSRRQESHCLSRDLKETVCVCVRFFNGRGWHRGGGPGLNLSGSTPHSQSRPGWGVGLVGASPRFQSSRRRRHRGAASSTSSSSLNGVVFPPLCRPGSDSWTAAERRQFNKGITAYKKDFFMVQKQVRGPAEQKRSPERPENQEQ